MTKARQFIVEKVDNDGDKDSTYTVTELPGVPLHLLAIVGGILAVPFLIICWCFYHPIEAKIYIKNALSLFLFTNWATRATLGIMILLLMLAFKKTHKFAKYTLWLLAAAGVVAYIVACF